jgi:hypothetical protein
MHCIPAALMYTLLSIAMIFMKKEKAHDIMSLTSGDNVARVVATNMSQISGEEL